MQKLLIFTLMLFTIGSIISSLLEQQYTGGAAGVMFNLMNAFDDLNWNPVTWFMCVARVLNNLWDVLWWQYTFFARTIDGEANPYFFVKVALLWPISFALVVELVINFGRR